MKKTDIAFLEKAFTLAEKARGKTSPNPFVGAIIANNGKIIGKGYTQPAGKDHAEIQALKQAGDEAQNSTMYITLEPCVHFGKTPPCTDAIIKAKIKKVVIGAKDPNQLVNGKGIERLKSAGIKVFSNLMPEKFKKQNEAYITYITKKRPFIIAKAAISLDGKMAKDNGNSRWISCEKSRETVHKLRNKVDAILSTVNTVNADNPKFTVRYNIKNPKHPIRIILDSYLNINPDSYVIQSADKIHTIIATSSKSNNEKIDFWHSKNVKIWQVDEENGFLNLHQIMNKCYKNEISQIMVEAGPTLITNLLKEKLIDKILLFVAPKILGGSDKFLFTLRPDFIGTENGWFKSFDCEKLQIGIDLTDISYKKVDKDIMIKGYLNYGKIS
ncbi:MAG: bifunctional diaminohydroxyphosphoribosylaminopyrimidine deaminase/5-amino-6-(5-phosphoribosylamino)uracil reductase RibD [Candidatus Cloacimonadota bacterium]|nr:bifunctional diaminohydroxyphosphoribosylaminopyrimidine deaminase/5-amino-6-(5-phosphoribosylamino)uracil reductase RibD [Candidatus Cloacimonadota bacterium]